jgi:hypothetical protein
MGKNPGTLLFFQSFDTSFNCRFYVRTWSKRRLIYTKEVITLTIPEDVSTDQSRVFDAIPMFQIVEIRKMESEEEESPEQKIEKKKTADESTASRNSSSGRPESLELNESKNTPSVSSGADDKPLGYSIMLRFSNSIEIRTSEEGFNSGRSYYVKVTSLERVARPFNNSTRLPES